MQKLLHSGTIADKISALSISIKENPDHALGSLNKLLEIVQLSINIYRLHYHQERKV